MIKEGVRVVLCAEHIGSGVMPINIQLEPLFEDKKKEQNVLKLFLLAFQEIPTILYIKKQTNCTYISQ
jgi:hypothetical protein